MRSKESRLAKIREAKAALEEEDRREAESKSTGDRDGQPPRNDGTGPSTASDAKPKDKKQRNFTDPESRIMN